MNGNLLLICEKGVIKILNKELKTITNYTLPVKAHCLDIVPIYEY